MTSGLHPASVGTPCSFIYPLNEHLLGICAEQDTELGPGDSVEKNSLPPWSFQGREAQTLNR